MKQINIFAYSQAITSVIPSDVESKSVGLGQENLHPLPHTQGMPEVSIHDIDDISIYFFYHSSHIYLPSLYTLRNTFFTHLHHRETPLPVEHPPLPHQTNQRNRAE